MYHVAIPLKHLEESLLLKKFIKAGSMISHAKMDNKEREREKAANLILVNPWLLPDDKIHITK